MTSPTFNSLAVTLARRLSQTCGQAQIRWLSSFKPTDLGVGTRVQNSPVWSHNYCRRSLGTRQTGSSKTAGEGDEELGDDDEKLPPIPSPGAQRSRGEKVKVKFAWKNSLVNADTANLLENLYQGFPELSQYGERELLQFLQVMSRYAIDVEIAVEILLAYPTIISSPDAKLQGCLQALISIGFSESQRKFALRRTPQLLDVPPKKITTQYAFLKSYLTSSETLNAIGKSIEILLESEATLKKKLEYLIKEMSHETKNIVSCKALAYSLRHMKTRHEFLIRAGLFKPIPYRRLIKVLERDYKDKSKPRDKYFTPLHVVCFSDADFLKVCTKGYLTLNEYSAFEELYEAELAAQEDQEEEALELGHVNDSDDTEDYDEDGSNDAVSLVKSANSVGYMSEAEAKNCYF